MEIWKEIYTCRIRKTKLFSTFYQIQVSTYHCNLATPSIHGGSLEITLTVRVRALFVKQLVFPVIIGDTDFLSSIMLCFLKEIFKNFNFLEFLKEMFFLHFIILCLLFLPFFKENLLCKWIKLHPFSREENYPGATSYTFNIHFNLQEYIS